MKSVKRNIKLLYFIFLIILSPSILANYGSEQVLLDPSVDEGVRREENSRSNQQINSPVNSVIRYGVFTDLGLPSGTTIKLSTPSLSFKGSDASSSTSLSASISKTVKTTFVNGERYYTLDITMNGSVTRSQSIVGTGFQEAVAVGDIDASIDASGGLKSKYQVTISKEDYEKIKRSEIPVPNPVEPQTIPVGSSISMTNSAYRSLKGILKGMGATAYEESKNTIDHIVTISRVDNENIDISSGDTASVLSKAGSTVGINSVAKAVANSFTNIYCKSPECKKKLEFLEKIPNLNPSIDLDSNVSYTTGKSEMKTTRIRLDDTESLDALRSGLIPENDSTFSETTDFSTLNAGVCAKFTWLLITLSDENACLKFINDQKVSQITRVLPNGEKEIIFFSDMNGVKTISKRKDYSSGEYDITYVTEKDGMRKTITMRKRPSGNPDVPDEILSYNIEFEEKVNLCNYTKYYGRLIVGHLRRDIPEVLKPLEGNEVLRDDEIACFTKFNMTNESLVYLRNVVDGIRNEVQNMSSCSIDESSYGLSWLISDKRIEDYIAQGERLGNRNWRRTVLNSVSILKKLINEEQSINFNNHQELKSVFNNFNLKEILVAFRILHQALQEKIARGRPDLSQTVQNLEFEISRMITVKESR